MAPAVAAEKPLVLEVLAGRALVRGPYPIFISSSGVSNFEYGNIRSLLAHSSLIVRSSLAFGDTIFREPRTGFLLMIISRVAPTLAQRLMATNPAIQ